MPRNEEGMREERERERDVIIAISIKERDETKMSE